jgi:hypothetical protein
LISEVDAVGASPFVAGSAKPPVLQSQHLPPVLSLSLPFLRSWRCLLLSWQVLQSKHLPPVLNLSLPFLRSWRCLLLEGAMQRILVLPLWMRMIMVSSLWMQVSH